MTSLSIPLGILAGLLASFVQSLGLTIQRKSHVINQQLPLHKQTVEHRRPLWLLGFAIFISSNIIGSFVQIASLPVVILAPLGAVSLLWNAFFARFILGDVFSPWMILGTVFIAGGAILIAVFGIVPEPTRSIEDLLELFTRPAFVAYFSVLGVVVLISLASTHIIEFSLLRRMAKATPPDSPLPLTPTSLIPPNPSVLTTGVTDVLTDSLPTERTPLLDPKIGRVSPSSSSKSSSTTGKSTDIRETRSINHTRLLLAISYASFSGIISGMCLLFAKSGVELLLLTFRGMNQFWRWEAWVLLLGLVVFALLQLWYLHKALILADPTLVCPSAFCFYNLSSIVNGLVYFDQFSLIPPLHLFLVTLGIIVLLGGVWVVSIHSGGGGVDLGAWAAETSEPEELEVAEGDMALVSQEQEGTVDVGAAQEAVDRPRHPVRIGPVPLDRETRSESSVPQSVNLSLREWDTRTSADQFFQRRATTDVYAQLGISPISPPLRVRKRRQTDGRGLSHGRISGTAAQTIGSSTAGQNSTHGHGRTASFGTLSPPTIRPGFQIGLSPLSPGFTVLPKERRRVSGLSIVGESAVREGEEREGLLESGVRGAANERGRTVSECGVRSREVDVDEYRDEGGEGESEDEERTRAKRRWRWLRRVLGF